MITTVAPLLKCVLSMLMVMIVVILRHRSILVPFISIYSYSFKDQWQIRRFGFLLFFFCVYLFLFVCLFLDSFEALKISTVLSFYTQRFLKRLSFFLFMRTYKFRYRVRCLSMAFIPIPSHNSLNRYLWYESMYSNNIFLVINSNKYIRPQYD